MNGRQVIRQLSSHLDSLTSSFSSASEQERALLGAINQYKSRKASLYSKLARTYLPSLESNISGAIREFDDEVQVLESQLQVDFERISEQLLANEKAKKEKLLELDSLEERLDRLLNKRFNLESKYDSKISSDSSIAKLNEEALEASEQVKASLEAFQRFESEAEEKLPEFEENSLFKYLLDRNYGTKDYQCFFLLRPLDKWVSKLCDFSGNKANYDYLQMVPELIELESSRLSAKHEALLEQISKEQVRVSKAVGLFSLVEEIEDLEDSKGLLVEALEDLDSRTENLLKKKSEKSNYYYELAIDGLEKHLEGLGWGELRNRAQSTESLDDDELVQDIKSISQELETLKASQKESAQAVSKKKSGLDNLNLLLSRFIQSGFDSEHSVFSGKLDFPRMLRELTNGSTDFDSAWEVLRRFQSFRRPQRRFGQARHARSFPNAHQGGQILGRVLGELARMGTGGHRSYGPFSVGRGPWAGRSKRTTGHGRRRRRDSSWGGRGFKGSGWGGGFTLPRRRRKGGGGGGFFSGSGF